MSISGRIVYCSAVTAVADPATGAPALQVHYRYSTPWDSGQGQVEGGDVYVVFDGLTETELSAQAQEKVLAQVNAETAGTEAFEASDIRGGRI